MTKQFDLVPAAEESQMDEVSAKFAQQQSIVTLNVKMINECLDGNTLRNAVCYFDNRDPDNTEKNYVKLVRDDGTILLPDDYEHLSHRSVVITQNSQNTDIGLTFSGKLMPLVVAIPQVTKQIIDLHYTEDQAAKALSRGSVEFHSYDAPEGYVTKTSIDTMDAMDVPGIDILTLDG